MTWTIEIGTAPPSANVLKRALYGGNRGVYRRIRTELGWALKVAARGVPRATGPRRVRIVRVMAGKARAYDHDNLVAGCKPLLDELVACGLLVDDSPAHVVVEYAQERGDERGTRIELEDAP